MLKLPVRSTLVRIGNSSILISPGSALSLDQLKALGNVTDIVAPSFLHTGGVPKAQEVFPGAKIWGPPGAKSIKPKISWTSELSEHSWPFQKELPMIFLEGAPELSEVVFFHQESKSLIVTDLVFNVTDAKGFGAWIIYNMFGTYRRFAVSKLLLKKYMKDLNAFRASIKKVLSFDFENIVMGHGNSVFGGAKGLLIKALEERGL